jgi:hypothetical protein
MSIEQRLETRTKLNVMVSEKLLCNKLCSATECHLETIAWNSLFY